MTRTMTDPIHTDIAIFGGGIAGLWLMNVLEQRGYSCVLLERHTLGGSQTLLSQGIIHGGLKYALGGALSSESEAIAGMPTRWRQHLAGEALPDLREVRVLSETQHLWSAGSMASRFTTFFASKMLRGRIAKLKFEHYPEALKNRRFKGSVYRMDDLVVDTESLLAALIRPVADRLLRFDPEQHQLQWGAKGIEEIRLDGEIRIRPRLAILAAGAGNEALLASAHSHAVAASVHAQRRPLQMLLVRHRLGHRFYAHCIGASNKPRLTVTTHELPDGSLVWYLGGELAERGTDMSADELVSAGRAELADLFPWLDFSAADFAPVRIDRAEPRQENLLKPDNAFVTRDKNVIVTWPTKLTLAPDLGDRVLAQIQDLSPSNTRPSIPAQARRAQLDAPPWVKLFGAADA